MISQYASPQEQAKAILLLQDLAESHQLTLTSYQRFQERYFNDPAGFIEDCIAWAEGESPADYQLDAITALPVKKRVGLRAPHGVGKTGLMSWAILWFALTRDGKDWKCPITASVWRQLTKYLLPELHKWARRLRWDKIGREPFNLRTELQGQNLRLSTGEAFALASNAPESLEGAHADHLLYIFDESKAIDDAIWDSVEGAFATGEVMWLACSTPGAERGRFYEINTRKPGFDDWHSIHVTKDQAISAGRMSAEWAESRRRQWGEDSAVYQNRVEGNFAADESSGVIPLSWVELANDRWEAWRESGFPGFLTELGVDVGEGLAGSDNSTIAHCYDHIKVREVEAQPKGSPTSATMTLVARIGQVQGHNPSAISIVDSVGVGVGVVHRLAELNFPVIPFSAGRGTTLLDMAGLNRFRNWRSAGWWVMRELLDPVNNFQLCLPPDDLLTGDLTSPGYRIVSDGIIEIESKESIRRRLGRSTDYGDAVMHALTGPILWQADRQEDEQVIVYERGDRA